MNGSADLNIAVIVGTKRKARRSIYPAKLITEIGNSITGVNASLVDPNDFNLPGDGNDPEGKDANYTKITKEADGFFIITPEYNHSFPGSLKRLLDSELKNYIHKPVNIAGVSSGRWGGVRAIEHLSVVTRELGMITTFADVQFPNVGEMFDKAGTLTDESAKQRIQKSWEELIWMAKVMKWGRENLPNSYHLD